MREWSRSLGESFSWCRRKSLRVALAAKTADVYVTRDGLMYASDWNAGLHALEYQG